MDVTVTGETRFRVQLTKAGEQRFEDVFAQIAKAQGKPREHFQKLSSNVEDCVHEMTLRTFMVAFGGPESWREENWRKYVVDM